MVESNTDLRGVPEAFRGRAGPMPERKVYELMLESRVLEERLIKISHTDEGHFWIGSPGEEAFSVPLGLQVKKGHGLDYDFLHLHYRSSPILTAMGAPMIDFIRQMASRATDPFSGGRNFINHLVKKEWNVVPGTSTIETQYAVAPGTALAQRQHGGDGITIVNGGDAGTAEGDFATCLNWSSRPGQELPILIIVTNNQWGISTPYDQVQAAKYIARRGEPFGIRWDTVNGNDPEASWAMIGDAMAYIRETRRPFVLEAYVSRLHGHSSSSGAAREDGYDALEVYEKKLVERGVIGEAEAAKLRHDLEAQALRDFERVIEEPHPDSDSIFDHTYA